MVKAVHSNLVSRDTVHSAPKQKKCLRQLGCHNRKNSYVYMTGLVPTIMGLAPAGGTARTNLLGPPSPELVQLPLESGC